MLDAIRTACLQQIRSVTNQVRAESCWDATAKHQTAHLSGSRRPDARCATLRPWRGNEQKRSISHSGFCRYCNGFRPHSFLSGLVPNEVVQRHSLFNASDQAVQSSVGYMITQPVATCHVRSRPPNCTTHTRTI
jgi:hypothetical protein